MVSRGSTSACRATRPPTFAIRTASVFQSTPPRVVRNDPPVATMGPVVGVEFERVEALELLGMALAHLNDAEQRAEMSPRVAVLMAIRDKLALGLREER
jgi:hypothetical protein